MRQAGDHAERTALEKRRLRRILRDERDALNAEERARSDALIFDALCAASGFRDAGLVLSYYSIGSEVDTVRIIEWALRSGKRVALPRITGPGAMDWHQIRSLDGVVASKWGIPEPACDPATRIAFDAEAAERALALVPALAFDAHGNRLGYGGGFYDRFLRGFKERGGTAWGLGRASQMREGSLPWDAHDVRVDAIVSDDGIRRCSVVPKR